MEKLKGKGYDIIGKIAIVKFADKTKANEKKKLAKILLKEHKSILTVLEKAGKVKGRLRTIKTKFLAGINTKETMHKENACRFKLNVDDCYFSPRLSNERLEVARQIKKKDMVLVMFAGVAPYSIVIAKLAKPKKVISIELGKKCCEYGKQNIVLNKLTNTNIEIMQGDVKRIIPKLAKKKQKFDKIVMARPQLKDTFLKQAFSVSKKGATVLYYDFGISADEILNKIKKEAGKAKKKIKVLKIKKAGEIAPYKYRWRVDLRTLS